MSEIFAAVGDALRRVPAPVYLVKMDAVPRLPRPSYLPDAPAQTPREYRSALTKLGGLGLLSEKVN